MPSLQGSNERWAGSSRSIDPRVRLPKNIPSQRRAGAEQLAELDTTSESMPAALPGRDGLLGTLGPRGLPVSDKSAIEWTEATWNPVTGCDRVSEGCDHCYAQTLAKRLKAMRNPRYQRDGNPRTSGPGFGVTLHDDQLELPLRWRHPRTVFVNSMSDLFHDEVPDDFIEMVFDVMEETSRHTYQLLTKRPGRLSSWARRYRPRPLPNVWIGTSVENQRWADLRIPKLLETPATVRFLSCEPLLGPIDLHLRSHARSESAVGWVIVGGESGPNARPMSPEWARALRDECDEADVPFFFKQWGGRTPKAGGRELEGQTWDEMPRRDSSVMVLA
jgi:protein gp37